MKDKLFELTYRSKARPDITEKEISEILTVATTRNEQYEISGCLVFHNGIFVQILEGNKENVLAIFEKIKRDIRHSKVELLWEGTCSERAFPKWDMAYLGLNKNAEDSEAALFKKNLLLLSQVSERPTASVEMFWQNVYRLLSDTYRKTARKG